MIAATDMQAQALGRLAQQYRDSTRLKAIVSLLVGQVEEIRDAALDMQMLRTIDGAEGDGLDILGEILGQPRELYGVVPVDFFAYHDGLGGPAGEGFGDLNDASAGQRYRSINEPPADNKELGDEEMRRFLRAAVVRNKTDATPEGIIAVIQAVLPDDPPVSVHLTFAPASTTATVQRVLSAEEVLILNAKGGIRGEVPVVPRPTGTALTVAGL